jgi:hypothetical protein
MNGQKVTIQKEEVQQLVEMLVVFLKLSKMERIAVEYYIKGRVHTVAENIEIPFIRAKES